VWLMPDNDVAGCPWYDRSVLKRSRDWTLEDRLVHAGLHVARSLVPRKYGKDFNDLYNFKTCPSITFSCHIYPDVEFVLICENRCLVKMLIKLREFVEVGNVPDRCISSRNLYKILSYIYW